MKVITHGRARLEKSESFSAILIYDTLDYDAKATPRPVKHVGNHMYIEKLWRKIAQKDMYLKDLQNPYSFKSSF